MHSPRKQQTIRRPAVVKGFGLWSGQDVQIEFRPAGPDTGLVFVREDKADKNAAVRIPALIQSRIRSPRRTTLSSGGIHVEMVEHILAALAGLHVDNCEVWTNAPEQPGCDGSSLAFVEALDAAGIRPQDAARECLSVRRSIRLGDDDHWIEAQPADDGKLTLTYHLDYGPLTAIGRQSLSLAISPHSFRCELASSRTFLLQEEAQWLRGQGLGMRATFADVLVFDDAGPIDNALRHDDECVRHKVLDLVGDLALAGCDLAGHVIAHRSGHELNAKLVQTLLQAMPPAPHTTRCAVSGHR